MYYLGKQLNPASHILVSQLILNTVLRSCGLDVSGNKVTIQCMHGRAWREPGAGHVGSQRLLSGTGISPPWPDVFHFLGSSPEC